MARASYQHVNTIRIGHRKVNKPVLSFDERNTIRQIQTHLDCATSAKNPTSADMSLTTAYRLLKLLAASRVLK